MKYNPDTCWAIVRFLIVLIVSFLVMVSLSETIAEKIPRENHCLEKELVHYRIVGGILKSNVETIKENSDFSRFKCIKWEEEPSFAKALLGQKLVE